MKEPLIIGSLVLEEPSPFAVMQGLLYILIDFGHCF